jgi:hypothetical protein
MTFDPDGSEQDEENELEELFVAFNEHVHEFAQEHDLNDAVVSMLALRLSLATRMFDYMMSTENPSGSGLKLELDRFRRDVEDSVRAMRKGADEYVAQAKQAIAEAEAEEKPD